MSTKAPSISHSIKNAENHVSTLRTAKNDRRNSGLNVKFKPSSSAGSLQLRTNASTIGMTDMPILGRSKVNTPSLNSYKIFQFQNQPGSNKTSGMSQGEITKFNKAKNLKNLLRHNLMTLDFQNTKSMSILKF